jgi:hypothetical protein
MSFDSRTHQNGSGSLPLFRPEAVLYQQQKSYGEIILIRPLSFTLLTWLVVILVVAALGLFTFGRFTEKVRLSGWVLPGAETGLQAELHVPRRWLPLVRPGTRLSLRCSGCPSSATEQTGTVQSISDTPLASSYDSNISPEYKVTVSLTPQPAQSLQSNPAQAGARVDAVIPLGRKPLIRWFFERSGS